MLISVIIPVYNAGRFIERAVNSVLRQTYSHIELILVNDGSTDESEAICQRLCKDDSRIQLISQSNSGPAAARNTGVRRSTGDFIFFLDADDFLKLDAFEKLIAAYNEYKPDLVMANFSKLINECDPINQAVTFSPGADPFTSKVKALNKNDIQLYVRHFLNSPSNHLISYCWARLYKASIIRDNNIAANEKMRLFEDFVFNIEYLKYTDNIIFVNEPLYVYTMHNNHISLSMEIIKANSLLHDMSVFKQSATDFLSNTCDDTSMISVEQEIGHALIHYTIIFLVRSCRQMSKANGRNIYTHVKCIVNSEILKDSLQHYSPSAGNSRLVPLFMKCHLISMIMVICTYKAYLRYGKPMRERIYAKR